jgi:hypothetical protein
MVGHDAPNNDNYERQSMAALEEAIKAVTDAIFGTTCPDCQTYQIEIAALRAKIKDLKWRLYGDS